MTAISAASPALGSRSRSRVGQPAQPSALSPDVPTPALGLVARDALIERLVAARRASLALLVAPVGYGKTTLLAQWAERDSRRFAWVHLGRADDDPLELARAIERAGAAAIPELRGLLESGSLTKRRRSPDALARSLAAALSGAAEPFVLLLDNGHALRSRESFAFLEALVDRAHPDFQIALSVRAQPQLPIARLRADRSLFELRVADLTLTRAEVGALAAATGLTLDDAACDLLAQRTEGWPAGVYLAALAVREASTPERALGSFGGDDRLVVEYVRDELLAQLAPTEIEFLARSSVLTRLSGALCNHVLRHDDSARVLQKLSRANLLVVPLDRTDTEYRYHGLFAEALRSELRLHEPGLEPVLHARASDWYAEHGEPGLAIEHALQAEDLALAGRLLWEATPEMLGYGQTSRHLRRLSRFSRTQIATSAPLALSAAAAQLALGDRALAEHWLATADEALRSGSKPPDPSLEGGLRLLRAAVGAQDVATMREEALAAYELTSANSAWRPVACFIEGTAHRLAGDRAAARVRLEEGARRGVALAPAVQVLCLAELALVEIDEGDWAGADGKVAIARAQVERVGLAEHPLAALVFAVSAEVNAHMSRPEACERDARHADRLLGTLPGFAPWYMAQCRIALAWAAVRLSEINRARELLAAAARDLHQLPDAVAAHTSHSACLDQVDVHSAARTDDAEQLTTAELRVLHFLPTHLSFPEIAGELYVSRNTVKTHVRAVYRKLMASSRSEAVQNARAAGLLDRLAA